MIDDDWTPLPHLAHYIKSCGCKFDALNCGFIVDSHNPKEYCDTLILYCGGPGNQEPTHAKIIKHVQELKIAIPIILYVPWGGDEVLGYLSAEINPDNHEFRVESLPGIFLLIEPITQEDVRNVLCRALGIKERPAKIRVRNRSRRQSLELLSERLEAVAIGISAFRLNSAAPLVAEISTLAAECRSVGEREKDEALRRINPTPETMIRRALLLLSGVFDAVGTKRGAEMIVAGAVAGIVSLGGWPAVSIYGLSMAAWMGKDSFIKAIKPFSAKK